MNTRCPYCETVFEVDMALIQAPDSRVRCGMCRSVFNARDRLLTQQTQVTAKSGANPEAAADFVSVIKELRSKRTPRYGVPTAKAEPLLNLKTIKAVAQPQLESPSKSSRAPLSDSTQQPISVASTSAEGSVRNPTGSAVRRAPQQSFKFDPDDPEEVDSLSDDTLRSESVLQRESRVPTVTTQSIAPADALLAKEKPTSEILTVNGATVEQTDELFEVLATRPTPFMFRRHRSGLWMLGSLALLLILVGQWSYANRALLINTPQLRLVIDGLCGLLSCDLEPLRALDEIELLRRSVYSHPNIDQALIISLALINKAEFAQPYPILRIRMADVRGQVVAQRDFQPTSYLDPATALGDKMPPGQPFTITLEIHDPGKEALTFELEFL